MKICIVLPDHSLEKGQWPSKRPLPPPFTYKADKALVKRGTKNLQMAEYWFPLSQNYREKMKNPPRNSVKFETRALSLQLELRIRYGSAPSISDAGSIAIVEGWAGRWKPQNAERWDYSLKSQWACSLFPNLLSTEVLPVTAVCHQAGRPGIAPRGFNSSWQYGRLSHITFHPEIRIVTHVLFSLLPSTAAGKSKTRKWPKSLL